MEKEKPFFFNQSIGRQHIYKAKGFGKKKKQYFFLRNGCSILGKNNDEFWFSDVLYKDGFSLFIESEI